MFKIKNALLNVFTSISLLLFFCCILILIIFFIINPGLFDNTKKVLTFIVEFFSIGGIIGWYFKKRIKQKIKEYRNVSKALKSFLIDEYLIHAMLWIFIIVQFIFISYFLAINSLVIQIEDKGSSLLNENIKVKILPDNYILSQPNKNNGSLIFKSKPVFVWGDSCRVIVTADGFEKYDTAVKWSVFSFLSIFSGYKLPIINLIKELVDFKIEVTPEHATIKLTAQAIDTSIASVGLLKIPKNSSLKILITADGCQSLTKTMLVKYDTTVYFDLKELPELPGKLFLRAFSEGGVEQYNLDIYINGEKIDCELGEEIILAPGKYRISLSKERQESIVFVPEFNVTILPGETIKKEKLKISIKSLNNPIKTYYNVILVLSAEIGDAEIFVDGVPPKIISRTPTMVTIQVEKKETNHRITIKKGDISYTKEQFIYKNNQRLQLY